jgi:hypothetical protein
VDAFMMKIITAEVIESSRSGGGYRAQADKSQSAR